MTIRNAGFRQFATCKQLVNTQPLQSYKYIFLYISYILVLSPYLELLWLETLRCYVIIIKINFIFKRCFFSVMTEASTTYRKSLYQVWLWLACSQLEWSKNYHTVIECDKNVIKIISKLKSDSRYLISDAKIQKQQNLNWNGLYRDLCRLDQQKPRTAAAWFFSALDP